MNSLAQDLRKEFTGRGLRKWLRVLFEVFLILLFDLIFTIAFGSGTSGFWHFLGLLSVVLIIEHQVMTRMAVEDLNKSIASIGPVTIDEKVSDNFGLKA